MLRVWGDWAVVPWGGSVGRWGGAAEPWRAVADDSQLRNSTLAGTPFILQVGSEGATLGNLAEYAAIGGIFFLMSALRLRRSAG